MTEASEPSPWATLHELAGAVREASDKVERDRKANEDRIKASVQKMRWFRRAAVLAVVAALVAVWAGARANTAVDRLRDQRADARIVQCHAENETAERINALNDRSQQLLRNAVAGNTSRTPEQQALADRFLSAELREYEAIKVPLRSCTPAAITAYYRK